MTIPDSNAVQKVLMGSVVMVRSRQEGEKLGAFIPGGVRVGDPDKDGMYPVEKKA